MCQQVCMPAQYALHTCPLELNRGERQEYCAPPKFTVVSKKYPMSLDWKAAKTGLRPSKDDAMLLKDALNPFSNCTSKRSGNMDASTNIK